MFGMSLLVVDALLGGSWVVISRVMSPLIGIVTLLITPLITTHEPPSGISLELIYSTRGFRDWDCWFTV